MIEKSGLLDVLNILICQCRWSQKPIIHFLIGNAVHFVLQNIHGRQDLVTVIFHTIWSVLVGSLKPNVLNSDTKSLSDTIRCQLNISITSTSEMWRQKPNHSYWRLRLKIEHQKRNNLQRFHLRIWITVLPWQRAWIMLACLLKHIVLWHVYHSQS